MRDDGRAHVAALLREQAGWCRRLGSTLYATLLDAATDDVVGSGPTWDVLRGHEADAPGSALALRFLGAVHRLVLDGRAPALASYYPSAGGSAGADGAWAAFRDVLAQPGDALRPLVDRPVQTNEVGRSAALLAGFLDVARNGGLPLRLLEIGASAGLNLRWDHFRYEAPGWTWGDPASPVRLTDVFSHAAPLPAGTVRVAARLGCDRAPLDPTTDDGLLTLRSYVWPDQLRRHELLRGAVAVARRVPASVDRADAPEWLARHLAHPTPGHATVVYHSIFWQYVPPEGQRALRETLIDAGGRASSDAPLAWVRLEPAGKDGPFVVRMTAWPGGADRQIAVVSPHGPPVRLGRDDG
jgi:hypothetical protein